MAKLSTDDLLDAFKEMTLLELSEFVKMFEETFDVTAAAPVAVAAAAPAAGGPAQPAGEHPHRLPGGRQELQGPAGGKPGRRHGLRQGARLLDGQRAVEAHRAPAAGEEADEAGEAARTLDSGIASC